MISPAGRGALVVAGLLGSPAAWARVDCADFWGAHYLLAEAPDGGAMQCEPAADLPADERIADASPPKIAYRSPGGTLVVARPLRLAGAGLTPERANPDDVTFRPTAFDELIGVVAHSYGQDPDLLRAIVHVESRFDPLAVSPRGAIGLMQVMPATAIELGVMDPLRTLLDPEPNLRAGTRYLASLLLQFPGRADLAIAAYNAGPGAVQRSGNAVPPFAETRQYVQRVLATWQAMREMH